MVYRTLTELSVYGHSVAIKHHKYNLWTAKRDFEKHWSVISKPLQSWVMTKQRIISRAVATSSTALEENIDFLKNNLRNKLDSKLYDSLNNQIHVLLFHSVWPRSYQNVQAKTSPLFVYIPLTRNAQRNVLFEKFICLLILFLKVMRTNKLNMYIEKNIHKLTTVLSSLCKHLWGTK